MPLLLLLSLVFLPACQGPLFVKDKPLNIPPIDVTEDGPPIHTSSARFIYPVQPMFEPMSRYGNPAFYAVLGKKYEVMRSAVGYKSRGTASWYGTKFHKQRTSSGECYDMYAMTAAHRTLPLPTWIRVKNLLNGSEVIVKVNDRGPFHKNRILDLSYAAAKRLGMTSRGTAPVEIETIAFKNTNRKPAAYYLQAGVFSEKTTASALKHQLQKHFQKPILIEYYHQQYTVKIGPFQEKQDALLYQKKLIKQGKKTIMVLQSVQ